MKAGDSETIGSLRHGNRCEGVVVDVVVRIQLEKKVDFGLIAFKVPACALWRGAHSGTRVCGGADRSLDVSGTEVNLHP